MQHDDYTVEHPADPRTGGTDYRFVLAACPCGWTGPSRRSHEKVHADALAHRAREMVRAGLAALRGGAR